MPAFCEQEQNKYTTKVREYSVDGMVNEAAELPQDLINR